MSRKTMSVSDLDKFSEEIAEIYDRGEIRGPIHLSTGSGENMQRIFQDQYSDGDWIFSTWRSHYHWLLSGRSPEKLKKQIVAGHSMHIVDNNFFTSSIVAGIAPIALGVAAALKLKGSRNKVLCFLGDMAASTGLAQECFRYARGQNLPVQYVIEDNSLSVTTSTEGVWGCAYSQPDKVDGYYYERKAPHAGTGHFVLF